MLLIMKRNIIFLLKHILEYLFKSQVAFYDYGCNVRVFSALQFKILQNSFYGPQEKISVLYTSYGVCILTMAKIFHYIFFMFLNYWII